MRICLSFDECKPHWAEQWGYDKEAERLGMRDIRIGGDFDSKVAYLYGTVDDLESFKTAIRFTRLREGSISLVSK